MARVAGGRGVVRADGLLPPPVDAMVVARLVDDLGTAGVAEVCGVFLADAGQLVGALRTAFELGDADAGARAAHRLKSASGFLGAVGFSSLCAEVEQLARQDRIDDAESRVDLLAEELERVSEELTALVGTRRP
jgi:HPt (histidine-containing phosphotransfer) domain-containing protein